MKARRSQAGEFCVRGKRHWMRAEQGINGSRDGGVYRVQVLAQELAEPVAASRSAWWPQAVGSLHGDRELFQQRLGEGETGTVGFRPVGLEVGADDHDGYAQGGGEPHLHTYSVIQAWPVQHRDHAGDPAQPRTVQFEEAASFAVADQVLFIGVAERQEHGVRPGQAGEPAGDVCAQSPVVGCEQPVGHVVQSHLCLLPGRDH